MNDSGSEVKDCSNKAVPSFLALFSETTPDTHLVLASHREEIDDNPPQSFLQPARESGKE